MPLPGSVTMVTVTEDYRRADGTVPTGTVTFTPSVWSSVAGTAIAVEPVTATLTDGQLSVALAWQDDPDLSPRGWTYEVVEYVGRERTRRKSVKLPQTGPVALHTLAPVDPVVPTEVRVRTVEGIAPDSSGNIDLPPAAGSAPNTRIIATTNGLQGGGDLTADRTLSPVYGSSAGTVCQGNDPRLSDARTPTAHTHPIADVTNLQATLDGKETAGAAAAAVSAHTAAGDPHPQYLTLAEGADLELYPPAAAGFGEWSLDPAFCSASWTLTSGLLILVRVHFRKAMTIDEVGLVVTQQGATPGAYSGVAVYGDGTGTVNRLAQSADQGASFAAVAGARSWPLTTSVTVQAGEYRRVGVLWQGTSNPRIAGSAAAFDNATMNLGVRRSTVLSGQTGFPTTLDVATMTLNNANYLLTFKDT